MTTSSPAHLKAYGSDNTPAPMAELHRVKTLPSDDAPSSRSLRLDAYESPARLSDSTCSASATRSPVSSSSSWCAMQRASEGNVSISRAPPAVDCSGSGLHSRVSLGANRQCPMKFRYYEQRETSHGVMRFAVSAGSMTGPPNDCTSVGQSGRNHRSPTKQRANWREASSGRCNRTCARRCFRLRLGMHCRRETGSRCGSIGSLLTARPSVPACIWRSNS